MNAIHARSQLRYWPTLVERIPIVPDPFSKTPVRAFSRCAARSGRGRRGIRRARVRTRQPLAQLLRGLVGGAPVERHQRRRHAGHPDDTGAPAIGGDRRHLDSVRSSGDRFFEVMDGNRHGNPDGVCVNCWSATHSTRPSATIKRSASRRRVHSGGSHGFRKDPMEKRFSC